MEDQSKFETFFIQMRSNRWYWLFNIFCRILLAFGFLAAGGVKIVDERFASGLSVNHPMGAYLEALHHTGYYYTFIGYAQILAAILLLIPRTMVLGALLYFPIIVNICILSLAVRFDGSLITAPLMVLANLFVLVWNYDRLRFLLPIQKNSSMEILSRPKKMTTAFPWKFGLVVLGCILGWFTFVLYGFEIMPRNSISDCNKQFLETKDEAAGIEFCSCIHSEGGDLDSCLAQFEIRRGQN